MSLSEKNQQERADRLAQLMTTADELFDEGHDKKANEIIQFIDDVLLWRDLVRMPVEKVRIFRTYELCEELTEYFDIDYLIDIGEIDPY